MRVELRQDGYHVWPPRGERYQPQSEPGYVSPRDTQYLPVVEIHNQRGACGCGSSGSSGNCFARWRVTLPRSAPSGAVALVPKPSRPAGRPRRSASSTGASLVISLRTVVQELLCVHPVIP
jgi:hypothetical protein